MANFKEHIPAFTVIVSIGIIITLFLLFSLAHLTQIGLTYDEAAFINAALGGVNEDYIYRRIFNIPVMVIPYLGALKSWIYYPIFKLIGVNIFSIRIPAILLGLATIMVWYKNARYLFRTQLFSLLFILILATDPAFINHVKIDFSPFVLQSLLIALAFYFYFNFLEKQRPFYLVLLSLTLILGVFNKLNFIWFVTAFLVSAFAYYRKNISSNFAKNVFVCLLVTAVFMGFMSFFVFFEIIPVAYHFPEGEILGMLLSDKIVYMAAVYVRTMWGFFDYIHAFFYDAGYFPLVPQIELGIITLALITSLFKKQKNMRPFIFCASIFLLMIIQILITPQARNSNHIMILWPLPHVLFLFSLRFICSYLAPPLASFSLTSIIILLFLSQLNVDVKYYQLLGEDKPPIEILASPAINQLADYINLHYKVYDEILSINFGINNQLIAYAENDQVRHKLHEEAWYLFSNDPNIKIMRNYAYPFFARSDQENLKWYYDQYFKNKNVLVIMFAGDVFAAESTHFFRFAYQNKLNVKPETFIGDAFGNVYALYSFQNKVDSPTI